MSGPTFHWDGDRRRWIIMHGSHNPVYSNNLESLTELAKLQEIDDSVEDWCDCDDAEAIWQKMVDCDPK